MNADDLLLIGSLLGLLTILSLVVYMLFKERWNKDSAVVESSLLKRRAAVYHAERGWLEIVAREDYGNNEAMLFCVTEDGKHFDFPAREHELVPRNNIENAVGERSYYEFVPDYSRIAGIRNYEATVQQHVAVTTQARRLADQAQAEAKLAQANIKTNVSEVLEEHAKLQKSQQQFKPLPRA